MTNAKKIMKAWELLKERATGSTKSVLQNTKFLNALYSGDRWCVIIEVPSEFIKKCILNKKYEIIEALDKCAGVKAGTTNIGDVRVAQQLPAQYNEINDDETPPQNEANDLNELITIHSNQLVTSSRMIAKKFGKEHRNVMRDIKNLISSMLNLEHTPMFYETEWVNKQNGQKYIEYLINRDGFSLLVMGFTGKEAMEWKLKYIKAFNDMENKLKSMPMDSYMIDDPIKRAERWIEEFNERKALAEENKVLKVKTEFTDKVLKRKDLVNITSIAKDYGMSGQEMNKLLATQGIQYWRGGQWFLYAKYQDKGYTGSETGIDKENNHTYIHTKWTHKGRLFIYDKLKSIGILPVAER